jgi:hypothetical protein
MKQLLRLVAPRSDLLDVIAERRAISFALY